MIECLCIRTRPESTRPLNFANWSERHIAFKLFYIGTNYHGFTSQAEVDETVETELYNALLKLKLIRDRTSCQFMRCGRTDRGVHALGQVVSLYVRSAVKNGLGCRPCKLQTKFDTS